MRILTTSEQKRISGGLIANSRSVSPMTPPRFSPIVPKQGGDGTLSIVPLIGPNELSYGVNVGWGNINHLSLSQKSVAYKTDLLGNVDTSLMHKLGGTTTIKGTIPDIDGSDISATAEFGTNNHLSGNIGIGVDGQTGTIGVNSSGDILGGGNFSLDNGEFTGKASFNFSNDTLSLSGSLFNFGPVTCSFDVFGLGGGGGGGGGGFECYGHPTVSQNIVGTGIATHADLTRNSTESQQIEIA